MRTRPVIGKFILGLIVLLIGISDAADVFDHVFIEKTFIGLWIPHLSQWQKLGVRLVLISIFSRFCIPMVALATGGIDSDL